MEMRKFRKSLLQSVAIISSYCPVSTYAQENSSNLADNDSLEIVVTAQRRSERKQNVPVTVTVLDEKLVQEARIASVADIVQHTPGVGWTGYPASEPRVAVRGIGSSSRGASGDPSSAVFIDEIYNGRPAGIAYDNFDVARIEVLKGPQGTLFGRNVTGGAVNIVTNRPNLEAFAASVEGTYGNYNQVDLAGLVNLPLVDGKIAVRLGGGIHRHDGYADRINASGAKVGELEDKDGRSGRFQLLVEPTEKLRFHLTIDGARDRDKGPASRIVEYTQASGGFVDRFFLVPFKYKTYATLDGQQDRDVWAARFRAEYDLPFATLSYLGSYKHIKYTSNYDFDGALSKITSRADQTRDLEGGTVEDSDLWSHELQLKSLSSSNIKWVAGVYNYSADTLRTGSTRSYRNPAIRTESITQDASTNSWAGYADVTVPVTDTLNIFGGARYTKDNKAVHSIGAISVAQILYVASPYDVSASKGWGAWSWRAGVDWHVQRHLMIYGSVSRGFKSGGFQDTPSNAQEASLSISPEFATSYEVGQRGEFFDGRLIWNNSIFYTKYDDLQTRVRDPNGNALILNAFATIYGYETELSANLGRGLRVDAAYGYTHTRYDDFPVFIGAVIANYKGNRLDWTPAHKVTLSPSYRYDLRNGGSVKLSVDYAHESTIYDSENNNKFNTRPPTDFVDARIIYKAPEGHWTLSVWGKNLTKEFTKTYDGGLSGVVIASYNPPRTYGMTLRWVY
jgi:iron complex outermembrane receptor protein